MRGSRPGAPLTFHCPFQSFQAIWKAMTVLPVPVASVSRTRRLPERIASTARLMAICW